MKGDKPTKSYTQVIKQKCQLPTGPRPGEGSFPAAQPPKAVANPPKSKVGMGG